MPCVLSLVHDFVTCCALRMNLFIYFVASDTHNSLLIRALFGCAKCVFIVCCETVINSECEVMYLNVGDAHDGYDGQKI